MSYTGTQVYLPADYSVGSIASWFTQKLPRARIEIAQRGMRVHFDNADLRFALDTAPTVRAEAAELARKAPANVGAALRLATQRLEITPSNPYADPDDVYNELLHAFEILRTIPNGVGLDPFDGVLYFDQATPIGSSASDAKAVEAKTVPSEKPATAKKVAAPKPSAAASKPAAKASAPVKPAAKKPVAKKAAPAKPAAKKPIAKAKKSTAAKPAAKKPVAKAKAPAKKPVTAKKPAAKAKRRK